MLTIGWVAVASVLLLSVWGIGVWALVTTRKNGLQPAPNDAIPALYVELAGKVAAIEVVVAGLPSLWDEERQRAKKHSDRALQAERRAAALLETDTEDFGLEEQADHLQQLDAARGEQVGMSLMPPAMALDQLDAERNQLAVEALKVVGR